MALAWAAFALLGLLALPAPAAAQTVTFISNTGQALDFIRFSSLVRATAFTTGTGTYTLSGVGIFYGLQTGPLTAVVEIYGDTGGNPGALVATMTMPAVTRNDSVVIFSAPANTTLSASTTYWLVTSNSATSDGRLFRVGTIHNAALDSGTAAGWSLGNVIYKNDIRDTSWSTHHFRHRFQIRGTELTPPPATVPGAPTSLSATAGGTTRINLSWSAPASTGGSAITGYRIEVSPNGTLNWTDRVANTNSTSTTYAHTGLAPGTTRHYRVSAINANGTGTASNTASATTTGDTNTAPTVANAIPDQAAATGTAFSYAFPANTFSDADGDTLTYTATKSDGTTLPSWLSFTPGTRTFSGTPQAGDVGTVSVKVTASDGNSGSVSDIFDIVTGSSDLPPRVASIVRQTPASSPTNADSLTWRVTFSEAVSNVDTSDFVVSGTTATLAVSAVTGITGAYDVTASGGNLASLNATVTLSLNSGNNIRDTSSQSLTDTTPTGTNNNSYVVDNTAPDTTAPEVVSATANGSTLVLTYNEPLDAASIPAAGDFAVTAAGSPITVNRVRVAGSTVTLTPATAVQAGQTVTLGYTPGATPIQDAAGNDAAGLSRRTVTNNTDTGPPPPPLPPPPPPPANTPPTASDSTVTAAEDQNYTFTAADFNYADGDGDALSSVTIVTLPASGTGTLRLGAGTVNAGDAVTSTQLAAGSFQYAPPANATGAGYARFTFRVNDGTDDSASAYTLTIDIAPEPVAAPGPPQNLTATAGDGTVALSWEAPLNPGASAIIRYEVRHAASGPVPPATAWASVGLTVTHTVTGLTNDQRYTFEVRAVNAGGAGEAPRAMATPMATPPPPPPVNDPPRPLDDAAETAEDMPVIIAVLENDRDADGDPLAVVEVSAPAHGAARLTDAGAVEYTPEPDFHGPDRFTYVMGDGSGLTAQAAVAVTVLPVNDPPLAVDDAAETAEDTPVTIAVLTNDRDADGDPLAVVEVSVPAHGTARLTDAGAVEYTPAPGFSGADRFTYVMGDGSGLTAQATVAVTVLPVNDPPRAAGSIPDQTLEAGDGPASLDLRPFFDDRDGDPLSYTAVASAPAVAVSLTDATLTLTVARPGVATVTVTAQDPGGLTATQAFMVTTTDRQARVVVEDTLAALGRGHLASARATLGRRVETTGQETSRVTVAGLHVPLGAGARGVAAAGQAVAERWITGLAGGMPLQPGGGTGTGAGMAPGAFGAVGALGSPAATLGMAGGAPFGAAGQAPFGAGATPAISGLSPLTGGGQTDFLLTLGSGQAGGGAAQGQRWTVWGQVDRQAFAGDPSPAARYDGDLRTTYMGVDARLGERWLAGVAVSRSRADGDWNIGASTGRLTTHLTSVQPYLRWSDGGTTIWATGGGGRGVAENERTSYGLQEESDLGLRLGLVEVRRRLATVGGGVELQVRGDAAWARLTTAAGDELIDALEVDVQQLRVGIDVRRPVRTAGGTRVEPFGEVHARHDGGSGQTGAGLEVAGGLRVARRVFRVEGMGRLLALHAADGYREHGAAVTLSVGDGARQPGLTLSLSPRWGAPATASDALWQDQLFHQGTAGAPGARRDERVLDMRVDYGLQLPAGGLLTPFGIYGQSPYGRRLQVGLLLSRLGPVGLEVSGERYAMLHPGRDDYRMSARGSITFGGAGHAPASLSAGQEAHRARTRDRTPRHR